MIYNFMENNFFNRSMNPIFKQFYKYINNWYMTFMCSDCVAIPEL